jgi:HD-like signal output (HDOD) protein
VVPLAEQEADRGLSGREAVQQEALRSLGQLPLFSPILNRLLASLTKDDVSFAKLGDLIEKDTVISGNILHMVNSALYSRSGTINSVRHALSILGISKLRNVVLGMSITRMWNQVRMPASWSMARFNLHSAASAMLSDMLSQRLPVIYPEGAFVAGLFHDVGQLLIALGLPDQHELILKRHAVGDRPHLECEREILGLTHPELSADALASWNLPEPIRVAIRYHHDPDADLSPLNRGEIPLSRVIHAAHQYVNSMGVTIRLNDGLDSADPARVEFLGLEPPRLESLLAEFKTELNSMAGFFDG